MSDLIDGESVEMPGSGLNIYTLTNTGGVYSCTCPAWRNQSLPIEKRTCKHLKRYRGEEAEVERLGSLAIGSPRKKGKKKSSGIVRRQDKSQHWEQIRYVVFDAPGRQAPFEERIEHLKTIFAKATLNYARLLGHERCQSTHPALPDRRGHSPRLPVERTSGSHTQKNNRPANRQEERVTTAGHFEERIGSSIGIRRRQVLEVLGSRNSAEACCRSVWTGRSQGHV